MSDLPVLLRMIRGEDDQPAAEPERAEPEAPEVPGAEPPSLPAILPESQVTAKDAAREAMSIAWKAALLRFREMSRTEDGMLHGLLNAKPPSVAEQCKYAQSRAWVPIGHDGGIAETAGTVYHAVIGRPGVALGNSIAALAARPLRFAIAVFLVTLALIVALVIFA